MGCFFILCHMYCNRYIEIVLLLLLFFSCSNRQFKDRENGGHYIKYKSNGLEIITSVSSSGIITEKETQLLFAPDEIKALLPSHKIKKCYVNFNYLLGDTTYTVESYMGRYYFNTTYNGRFKLKSYHKENYVFSKTIGILLAITIIYLTTRI